MRVRVVEGGHEQFAAPVVHLAERRGLPLFRRGAAHVGDAPVAHTHPLVRLEVQVLVEKIDVSKQHAPLLRLRAASRESDSVQRFSPT